MGVDFNSEEFEQKAQGIRLKVEEGHIAWEKQQAAKRKEWEQNPHKWVEYMRDLEYTEDDIYERDGGVVIRGADGSQVWFDPVYLTKLENLEPDFCDTTYDTDSIVGDIIYAQHSEGFNKMKQELAEYEAEARGWDRPHRKRPQIDDPTKYRVID